MFATIVKFDIIKEVMIMGFFNKLKSIISKKEEIKNEEVQAEIEDYENGLKKTRDDFVSKLNILGIKYTKVF